MKAHARSVLSQRGSAKRSAHALTRCTHPGEGARDVSSFAVKVRALDGELEQRCGERRRAGCAGAGARGAAERRRRLAGRRRRGEGGGGAATGGQGKGGVCVGAQRDLDPGCFGHGGHVVAAGQHDGGAHARGEQQQRHARGGQRGEAEHGGGAQRGAHGQRRRERLEGLSLGGEGVPPAHAAEGRDCAGGGVDAGAAARDSSAPSAGAC
jgi:hypothetical protein